MIPAPFDRALTHARAPTYVLIRQGMGLDLYPAPTKTTPLMVEAHEGSNRHPVFPARSCKRADARDTGTIRDNRQWLTLEGGPVRRDRRHAVRSVRCAREWRGRAFVPAKSVSRPGWTHRAHSCMVRRCGRVAFAWQSVRPARRVHAGVICWLWNARRTPRGRPQRNRADMELWRPTLVPACELADARYRSALQNGGEPGEGACRFS
jgi:hypothetical protein